MRFTRSLADGEIRGQGSDVKSMVPRRTASKMPCSVSAKTGLKKCNTQGVRL
jgi:hypothetical protein